MEFANTVTTPEFDSYVNGLNALVAGGSAGTSTQELVAYISLLAFLILLLCLRFFSNRNFFGEEQIGPVDFQSPTNEYAQYRAQRRVDHLFLKMNYSSVKAKNSQAYLRSLEPRGASLMIPEMLWVGSRVVLHLNTLPGFPNDHLKYLDAKVVSCSTADDQKENYIVKVKFESAAAEEVRQPILGYIDSLARPVG